ncbi:MAG: metal-sensitive transcriptional regulator [Patescibacteria group bacterium]
MQPTVRSSVAKRLKIIEGHLRKVIKMVEDGAYCPDVIQQSTAVQSALRKVDEILLEGHLKDCVRGAIKSGGGDKEIQELLEAFRKR